MRLPDKKQNSIHFFQNQHHMAKTLREISNIIEENRNIINMITEDLNESVQTKVGRKGLTGRMVLCLGLLKKIFKLSYRQLEFQLSDSATFKEFCGLTLYDSTPTFQCIQYNLKKVSPDTLKKANGILMLSATQEGIAKPDKVRIDTTSVESKILRPADSRLLRDIVYKSSLIMKNIIKLFPSVEFVCHKKEANKKFHEIRNKRKKSERIAPYTELIEITKITVKYLLSFMDDFDPKTSIQKKLSKKLLKLLIGYSHVIDQSKQRVIDGESVPSKEKIVSIHKLHTEILVKRKGKVEFGHKVHVVTDDGGFVLSGGVYRINIADTTMYPRILNEISKTYGTPSIVACDGGFASKANLELAKKNSILKPFFHKKRGLKLEDMNLDAVEYVTLRNFRAGVEANISTLKTSFGMSKCDWETYGSFKSYVHLSILSYNLLKYARKRIKSSE